MPEMNNQSQEKPSVFLSNNFILTVIALVVGLVAALNYFLHFPLTEWLEKRELSALDQLRDSYAHEIESQLTSIDVVIDALASTAASDRYSAREKHLLLSQTTQALPSVRVIGIVDQTGMIEHSSRTFPAPDVDLSGRDYIDYFLNGGKASRFLSGPVRNAVDNRWQISLSRPIRDVTGTLSGVITSVIVPEVLIDQMSKSSINGDRVTLLDPIGRLIAQFPKRVEEVGNSLRNSAGYEDLLSVESGVVSGVYEGSLRDGAFLLSMKRIFADELVLTTSRSYSSAMAYWRTISTLISLASVAIGLFICWTLHTLHRHAANALAQNVELAQANAQIDTERENAERLARIKEDFLANMSHEIRTPMNAITGLAQLLERCDLKPTESEYVRQIRMSGKFLLGIIEEILTFSKMESGGVAVDQEPYRLSDIIDNVGSLLSVAMEDKAIDVVINIDPDLPEVLVGDAQKTKQILVNLASNAIKFTEKGSVRLSAKHLRQLASEDQLVLEVRDTGIGISPDKLATIFDPFNQADNSAIRQHGGTGLGLAISKRLAESLGGSIHVSSEADKGSTFRVTLPCRPAQNSDNHRKVTPRHTGIHVLIVDDHPATLEALGTLATENGLHVVTAGSGEKAMALIAQRDAQGKPFDAILIDWQMPGMDGLQVIQTLQAQNDLERLPAIIMVTAYQREMIEKSGANTPHAFEILSKPVTASTLRNVIDAAVTKSSGPTETTEPVAPSLRPDILKGVTILVAEDNPMNQQVARELLTSVGADVEIVGNGVDVLSILQTHRFDLVLMDVQMPVMDGIEAAKLIKEIPEHVNLPIIALTAGVLDSERRKCKDAGMVGFIGKPFDFDIVVSKIRDTLGLGEATSLTHAQKEEAIVSDETPLWDRKRALVLAGGKEHLLRRLATLYPAQIREQLVQLIDAMNTDDAQAAATLLHSMQGSSSQIAAQKAASIGKELENIARDHGIDPLKARFEGFPEIIENTARKIESAFTTTDPEEAAQAVVTDFAKLIELLESGNAEAIAEFRNQRENLMVICSPLQIADMETNLRSLEFVAVLETLRSLKQSTS